ncbi:MAG: putative dihydrofolate reductase type I involved in trimethoprim resistance [uncultured bacterium]|nr:MAG: putative dihydrofolate reductase type I involved in trimethoprim resistance [uncultured bacterium]HBR71482.1 diacylglycerol kinase [Candidatus Moranbacteria bacterium]
MISIIVAVGKNNSIGRNNKLLWNLPNDLKHFQKITSGHIVIMGDRTYESIGRLLPNRRNIIVSLKEGYVVKGGEVINSLEKVLNEYKKVDEEVFVIGGGIIYRLSLPFADKLYVTLVDDEPQDADTFFPDYSEFKNIVNKEDQEENGVRYSFLELTK